jgi:hypothetical protein
MHTALATSTPRVARLGAHTVPPPPGLAACGQRARTFSRAAGEATQPLSALVASTPRGCACAGAPALTAALAALYLLARCRLALRHAACLLRAPPAGLLPRVLCCARASAFLWSPLTPRLSLRCSLFLAASTRGERPRGAL